MDDSVVGHRSDVDRHGQSLTEEINRCVDLLDSGEDPRHYRYFLKSFQVGPQG